jgi:hypothetical protein
MSVIRVILGLALTVCLSPIVSTLIAMAVAEGNRCRLDEAIAYPCKVMGVDLGGPLANMYVFGWLSLVTLPAAVLVGILWAFMEIALWLRRRHQNDAGPTAELSD